MPNPRWLVVADPFGKVIALAFGAPETWRGMTPETAAGDAEAIGGALRDVRALLLSGNTAPSLMVNLEAAAGPVDVEVVALSVIAIHRAPADLREIVVRAVAPFRAQASDRDVHLGVESVGDPLVVLCDEAKIVWVVATIVGNALRFTRAGTRRLPGGSIHVRVGRDDGVVFVEVTDDGPGIEPARLRHLFEADSGQNPAGVALRMAREVAQAHGGRLEVESSVDSEDHHTTVRLELPTKSASAGTPRKP